MNRRIGSITGLALVYGLAFGVAIAALGGAVYLSAHRALALQLDARILNERDELIAIEKANGFEGLMTEVERRGDGHRVGGIGYMVVDRLGQRVGGRLEAPVPPVGWSDILFRDRAEKEEQNRARALRIPMASGTSIVIATDTEPVEDIDETIAQLFAAAFAIMVVLAAIGSLGLGAVVRRRLDAIQSAASGIIDGDLSRRVATEGSGGDFDRLASTLNRMLDRMGDLLSNLRRVTDDIAHDLRRPMTRLRSTLDETLAAATDVDGYRAGIEHSLKHVDEALSIFNALLRISEVDAGRMRAAFGIVDLSGIVSSLCEAFGPSIEDCGSRLTCDLTTDLYVDGDAALLTQMISNLFDNAVQHTPAGSHIDVSLRRETGKTVLSIADDGPGIDPELRNFVLQRFSRLQRSRSKPGHGLGLSLVHAIARLHGIDLVLADHRPGLKVRLIFPVESS